MIFLLSSLSSLSRVWLVVVVFVFVLGLIWFLDEYFFV